MTELWFSETKDDIRAAWRVKSVLYEGRSQYQSISIIDTAHFGRMLILDGCVMTTERDECAYHEMLVHPALLAHPSPKHICIVGGGDGGTVREVLKHDTVERVVLAEIDADVISVCREFLPSISGKLDDPRVEIAVGDGARYLQEHAGQFDIVLSDSTDPIGPGEVLFADQYFEFAKRALRNSGVFVTQCEGPWVDVQTIRDVAARMLRQFPVVLPYVSAIPTYPSGTWSFLLGSDGTDPRIQFDKTRQSQIAATAKYYTPAHQTGAFAVPAFLNL